MSVYQGYEGCRQAGGLHKLRGDDITISLSSSLQPIRPLVTQLAHCPLMSWLPRLRPSSFRRYSSCAASVRSQLEKSPIAYHFLRTPIPYDIGLQLQENIVDTRASWRKAGKETGVTDDVGDVVLLLGEPYLSIHAFPFSSSQSTRRRIPPDVAISR